MQQPKFYKNAYIYLTLGIIFVFIGFSKTYFSRLGDFALPYHLHGISATLWMFLLAFQPYLYKKGFLKTHRKLGWTSVILVPIIVGCGLIMMQMMIQGQANYPPGTVYKLAFIDTVTLIGFVVVYILALVHRKNVNLHSRYMVSTIFGPLLPALTRIFIFNLGVASTFNQGLTYAYLMVEIALLLLIWKERKAKEIKLTYIPFLIFIAIQHALMYSSNDWVWWRSIMDSFANYSS